MNIPKSEINRYYLIDSIRGLAIINMVAYHLLFDLVFIYGLDLNWFRGIYGFIWEQFICWTFILISGMTQNLSHHPYKDFLYVSISGIIVTLVTVLFSADIAIYFGILTFIGAAILVVTLLKKVLKTVEPITGFTVSFLLFLIVRNINYGYLGFGTFNFYKLPEFLYPVQPGWLQTFIGFTARNFSSSDYFSFFPWIFLYICGFYLFEVLYSTKFKKVMKDRGNKFLAFLGRHSLLIYLLHQPIIMLILMIIF